MDGNGRWAAQRHLPRVATGRASRPCARWSRRPAGHRRADALRVLGRELEAAARRGRHADGAAEALSPARARQPHRQQPPLSRDRTTRRSRAEIQAELDAAMRRTAGTGMRFNIALNYGGRAEIVEAARRAIREGISADDLDEQRFGQLLYGPGSPTGPADSHERDAREQLPALADRLLRDLRHRHPGPTSARATCSTRSWPTRNASADTGASSLLAWRSVSDASPERHRPPRGVRRGRVVGPTAGAAGGGARCRGARDRGELRARPTPRRPSPSCRPR